MFDINFLGICSNQTASDETVSLLIQHSNQQKLLIDIGPGILKQIYKLGIRAIDIDNVVLTHVHGDHLLGFPYFVFSIYTELKQGFRRDKPIRIISSEATYKAIQQLLELVSYPSLGTFPFGFVHCNVNLEVRSEFDFEGIEINTLSVQHSVPTFGVRISDGKSTIAYSSDSVYCPNVVELSRQVDLLIHEGMGLSGKRKPDSNHGYIQDAARSANEAHVNSLALVHLSPDAILAKEKLLEEGKALFSGDIFVPNTLVSYRY